MSVSWAMQVQNLFTVAKLVALFGIIVAGVGYLGIGEYLPIYNLSFFVEDVFSTSRKHPLEKYVRGDKVVTNLMNV